MTMSKGGNNWENNYHSTNHRTSNESLNLWVHFFPFFLSMSPLVAPQTCFFFLSDWEIRALLYQGPDWPPNNKCFCAVNNGFRALLTSLLWIKKIGRTLVSLDLNKSFAALNCGDFWSMVDKNNNYLLASLGTVLILIFYLISTLIFFPKWGLIV